MRKFFTTVVAVIALLAISTPAKAVTGTPDPTYAGSVLSITSNAKSLTGTVGQYFSASFQVNGGTPVYNWQVDPALPAGLVLTGVADAFTNCANPAGGSDVTAYCPGAYYSGQNITISGTPTQVGTTTAKFTVMDAANHRTAASFVFTMQQGGGSTSHGITVTNPAGGELWTVGSTRTITWIDETGSSVNRNVYISLEPYIACLYSNPACAIVQIAPYVIASNAPGTGSFTWTIPTDLPTRYQTVARINISTTDGALSGSSGVFSVASTGRDAPVKSGYVDAVSSTKVSGWAYDQTAQPTCVNISYQRVYTTNATTDLYIQPAQQQVCPSINRTDAEQWLRNTYGSSLNIQQPLGFTVNPSTVLSAGTYIVKSVTLAQSGTTLQMSDAAKASFTIGSVSANPLTLTTDSNLTGSVGQNFSAGFLVSGGSEPYQQWQIASGSLPPGLAMSFPAYNCFRAPCIAPKDTMYVSGTPTTNGNFPFTLRVTDSAGRTVEQQFTITIGNNTPQSILVIATGSLQGVVGTSMYVPFSASNGTAPYTLQLDAGTLPPGLSFSPVMPPCAQPADGSRANCEPVQFVLMGTPTVPGTYAFTVSAKDAVGGRGSQSFTSTITNGTTPTRISVTNPQKDQTWARGQAHTIRWSPSGSGSAVTISVSRYIACLHNETYICAIAQPAPVVITTSASDSGSYTWNTPSDFAVTGAATIIVSNNATGQAGESAPFQISEKTSTGCPFSAGQLVVGNVGTVYIITVDCTKYGFTSYQDFISRGYKFSQVIRVDQSTLDGIRSVDTLPRASGITFKYEGKAAVYYLNTALCKELYPSLTTLRAWKLDIRDIVTIATSEQYPDCNPSYVRLPENTPVRANGDGTIYVVRTGARYPFGNIGAFYRAGFSFKQVVVIPTSELGLYPLGGILE